MQNENKPLYGGIPNGHLYAQLMNQFSLDQWISIVEAMKQSGLITESNRLLKITDRGEGMHKEMDAIYTEAKEDVQSFADEVESAAGEVEAAEFPGMYS